MLNPHRNTIYSLTGAVLQQDAFAGDQFILKITAPEISNSAKPGQFVHLQCHPSIALRRPFSIMRVQANHWLEILYKVVGQGTRALSQAKPGDSLDIMGPIGHPFQLSPSRPLVLLLGGGVGIPPMILMAQHIKQNLPGVKPVIFMGSEVPFPFRVIPSNIMVPEIPAEVTGAMPLMEDWGFTSRLCSHAAYPGCYQGYVTDLARLYLAQLDKNTRSLVEVFACGPHAMLHAAAQLAHEFQLPCQLCLEEYMACGVGGCAACTIPIYDQDGKISMKRVCVDGPVFTASQVYPQFN